MCLKSSFKSVFIDMLSVQRAMGWLDPLFLSCLTDEPGTQKGPQARAWAGGQARRPVRHGPYPAGHGVPPRPLGNVPCQAGPLPGIGIGEHTCMSSHIGTCTSSRAGEPAPESWSLQVARVPSSQ